MFNRYLRKLIMTVEEKLDQILAKLDTLAPSTVDTSKLATGDEVAALSAKIDALTATIGTDTTPSPPPTPATETTAA